MKLRKCAASWRKLLFAGLIDLGLVLGMIFSCPRPPGILGTFVGVALWLLGWGYFVVGDSLMGGARLGKRIFGLRRIGVLHRAPCSLRQDLLRHLPVGFSGWFASLIDPGRPDGPDETYVIDLGCEQAAELEELADAQAEPREKAAVNLDGICGYLGKDDSR